MDAQAIATPKVRRASRTASVIELPGEVTAASEQGLMAAYARAVEDGPRAVVLDFGALEYMSSGGIGLLVALLVRSRRQHRRLLAVGLGGHYREIFALTRLDEAIEIHGDLAAALAAGGPPLALAEPLAEGGLGGLRVRPRGSGRTSPPCARGGRGTVSGAGAWPASSLSWPCRGRHAS